MGFEINIMIKQIPCAPTALELNVRESVGGRIGSDILIFVSF